jgi:DNA-binding beta-propeller fold protein YncE
VAIDAGGNVYVAEETGSTIYKIDSGNNNISSFVTVDSSQKYGMIVVDDHLYISYYNSMDHGKYPLSLKNKTSMLIDGPSQST